MARWGMAIDLDKCTGCGACVVACRAENNVSFVEEDQAAMGRSILWMQLVPIMEGEYPEVKTRFIPMPCFQCENPPCIKVCPVGATYLNSEGLVAQIYPRCIGCRFCTVACPYTRRFFNWYRPEWTETLANYRSPDVSIRPKGVVEKCSFCTQRIRAARDTAEKEERPMRDGEVVPACAEACPAIAITFGDLDDPESQVRKLSKSPRSFRILEDLGTEPKVYYLSEVNWNA